MLLVETKRIARRTAVRRHARGLSDRPPDARNSASQNRPVRSSSKKITRTLQKQYSCHWWRRRGSNSRPYGCEPYALPAELRPHLPPIFQRQKVLYHKIFNCKERFFLENKNFQLPIAQGYSKINKLLVEKSSASSCGAGLAQCNPANHVRRGTEQH